MAVSTGQSTETDLAPVARPHLHFNSRNLGQALEFLHDKDLCFDIARRNAGDLDVHLNGFYLPAGLYVGLTEYGAKVTVRPNPRRLDYWIWMPIRGRMETRFRGQQYLGDERRGCILSFPSMGESRNLVDARAGRITVVLSHASLHRQLAQALRAFQDFERRGPMTANPLAMTSFEQFIINELLLSHPHNYTHAVHAPMPAIAPRDVKRAIDYMEAHLQSPIVLADIVGAAGVPGRTLFKHFAEYRGLSPMEYLRDARFERVRAALRQAVEPGKVSDIAMAWGFSHMGRFSTEYRKRYGERPSETVRRFRDTA